MVHDITPMVIIITIIVLTTVSDIVSGIAATACIAVAMSSRCPVGIVMRSSCAGSAVCRPR